MVVVTLAWILSAVLIGLLFSMSANERQRQMAVFRSLGATKGYVLTVLLTESSLLAVCASAAGSIIGSFSIFIFRNYFAGTIKMPFLFPSISTLLLLSLWSLILSFITVSIGTVLPAIRISRLEPAIGMRE
jgi:putative ABC transport system permease protein